MRVRQDPYLQKLLEVIYRNINSRFQVFENSYKYLDAKNRDCVTFGEFSQGLQSFGIAMSPHDRRLVFAYLTDRSDTGGGNEPMALMSQDQFMKLKDEAKERNIDPSELRAFQEHLSAKAPAYE
jgi:hypothetical protein